MLYARCKGLYGCWHVSLRRHRLLNSDKPSEVTAGPQQLMDLSRRLRKVQPVIKVMFSINNNNNKKPHQQHNSACLVSYKTFHVRGKFHCQKKKKKGAFSSLTHVKGTSGVYASCKYCHKLGSSFLISTSATWNILQTRGWVQRMEHLTRISLRAGELPDDSQLQRGWKNRPANHQKLWDSVVPPGYKHS